MKKFIKILFVLILSFGFISLTSCDKPDEPVVEDKLADGSYSIEFEPIE